MVKMHSRSRVSSVDGARGEKQRSRANLRGVDAIHVREVEDEDVGVVPVWLVRRVVFVMPIQLEPP